MTAKTIRGIDDDLWRRVRLEAIRQGMTVQAFVIRALERATEEERDQ